ncbi:MAG: hypothetical protein HOC24_09370 [Deltaproteobacteria bacterium]|jgi:hypothetical protein|nr:hypothetical protein [Deltaproteobacteria bacterium]
MKTLLSTILLTSTIAIIGTTTVMAQGDINSGREFGKHVKQHNDMFSGTMNPGVHHKGYSTLKK